MCNHNNAAHCAFQLSGGIADNVTKYVAAYKRKGEEIKHPGAQVGEIYRSTSFSQFVLFIAKHTATQPSKR